MHACSVSCSRGGWQFQWLTNPLNGYFVSNNFLFVLVNPDLGLVNPQAKKSGFRKVNKIWNYGVKKTSIEESVFLKNKITDLLMKKTMTCQRATLPNDMKSCEKVCRAGPAPQTTKLQINHQSKWRWIRSGAKIPLFLIPQFWGSEFINPNSGSSTFAAQN